MHSVARFFLRARASFLIVLGILSMTLNISAQQNIQLQWPLTSPQTIAMPSSIATLGFSAGRGVDSLYFSPSFGAVSNGWNTDNLDPEAYYEYTITPARGTTMVINQMNFEVSLNRVNMRTSVQYSYDNFRSQKVQIGHTIYIGTQTPRNLPVKTSLQVSYPQTLSVRIYGWSSVDYTVSFHNRNVSFDALAFGKDLPVSDEKDQTDTLVSMPEQEIAGLSEPVQPEILPQQHDTLPGYENIVSSILGSNNFTTPGVFEWVCPPNVTSITVECQGGGGRGASLSGNGVGGGGGGGAYSRSVLSVIPGTTYFFRVGAGSNSTFTGQTSWFSPTNNEANALVLAAGGNSANNNSMSGATGGLFSSGIGTVRYSGGTGATVLATDNFGGGGGSSAGNAANGNNATNGTGATAPAGGGNGGSGSVVPNVPGTNGVAPGGGGGGGFKNDPPGNNTPRVGGTGGNGQVTISWPDPPSGSCEGYAIAVFNQTGVNFPANALGSPDNVNAMLEENADVLQLDLINNGYLLANGATISVRWRASASNTPIVRLRTSSNGISWNDLTSITVASNVYVFQSFTLTNPTRYLEFSGSIPQSV